MCEGRGQNHHVVPFRLALDFYYVLTRPRRIFICGKLCFNWESFVIRVELLPTFKFTGKTVKIMKFTDNYR